MGILKEVVDMAAPLAGGGGLPGGGGEGTGLGGGDGYRGGFCRAPFTIELICVSVVLIVAVGSYRIVCDAGSVIMTG